MTRLRVFVSVMPLALASSCALDIQNVGLVKNGWQIVEAPTTCNTISSVSVDPDGVPWLVCFGDDGAPEVDAGIDLGPPDVGVDPAMAISPPATIPRLVHRSEGAWSTTELPGAAYAVHATADLAWVAGDSFVARVAGGAIRELPVNFAIMRSIWPSSADDVWIAGSRFVHFDGELHNVTWPGETDLILAMWGASPSDIWAVSTNGVLRHFDGRDWSVKQRLPDRVALRGICGRTADDAWVVGDGGLVLHWDGATWSELDRATKVDLNGIACDDDGAWIVGGSGTILRVRDGALEAVPSPTTKDLLSVSGTRPGATWAVGADVVLRLVR